MSRKGIEEDLDTATEEFIQTFNTFKKAAKKLMAVLDSMKKRKFEGITDISGGAQWIHEFLIQIMDESGQIREKTFGIKCLAEEEKDRDS